MEKPKLPEGRILKEGEDPDKARERQQKGKVEIKLTDKEKEEMEGLKVTTEVGPALANTDALVATRGDLRRMEERMLEKIESITFSYARDILRVMRIMREEMQGKFK